MSGARLPLYCELCKKEFSGTVSAEQHFISEAHRKKEDQKKNAVFQPTSVPFWCETCSISCNSPEQFTAHTNSPKHNEMVKRSLQVPKQLFTALEFIPAKPQTSDRPEYFFDGNRGFCNLCEIELTSQQHVRQHVEGSKHQKKKNPGASNIAAVYKCEPCNVPFSGIASVQEHLRSARHLKRVRELGITAGGDAAVYKGEGEPLHAGPALSTNCRNLSQIQQDQVANQLDEKADYCYLCKVVFTSPQHAQQHLAGSKHKKAEKMFSETRNSLHGFQDKSNPREKFPAYPLTEELAQTNLALNTQSGHGLLGDAVALPLNIQPEDDDTNMAVPESLHSLPAGSLFGVTWPEPKQMYTPISIPDKKIETVPKLSAERQKEDHTTFSTLQEPGGEQHFTWNGSKGWCRLCSVDLTSQQMAKQHLNGKSHAKALQGTMPLLIRAPASPLLSPNAVLHSEPAESPGTFTNAAANMSESPEYVLQNGRGRCNVCSVEFTSKQHAEQHLQGKNHAKEKQRQNMASKTGIYPLECELCVKSFSGPESAAQHFTSAKHLSKAAMNIGDNFLAENPFVLGNQSPVLPVQANTYMCDVCRCPLNTYEQLCIHRKSPKHFAMEAKLQVKSASSSDRDSEKSDNILTNPDVYNQQKMSSQNMASKTEIYPLECELCVKSFSGPESSAQHFTSAKHLSKAAMNIGDNFLAENPFVLGNQSPVLPVQANTYMCDVCRCPLNTYEQLCIHRKSPKHFAMEAKLQAKSASSSDRDSEKSDITMADQAKYNQSKMSSSDLNSALLRGEITEVKEIAPNVSAGINRINPYGNSNETMISDSRAPLLSPHRGSTNVVSDSNSSYFSALSQPSQNGNVVYDRSSCSGPVGFKPEIEELRVTGGTFDTRANVSYNQEANYGGNGHPASNVTSVEEGLCHAFQRLDVRPKIKSHNPLKNQNSTNRSNKALLSTCEESDAQDERSAPGLQTISMGDKDEAMSFASCASSVLNKGWHGETVPSTTDNNVSLHTSRTSGLAPLLQDQMGSDGVSHMETLSEFSCVRAPPKPNENPFKGFKYYCPECKRPMNTNKDYEAHLKSQGHLQNVATRQAPVRPYLEQIRRNMTLNNAENVAFELTETMPRTYQVGLFCYTMTGDKVIFLPTGTGKTLVSVMTMSCMLMMNPRRPVLFLVDKVLLVLQQYKYILKELENKKFKRFHLDDGRGPLVSRNLKIGVMCGNLMSPDGIPLYLHDIIVTTAAFAENLLDKQQLHWTDFSLVVFDEAHHCAKRHPFNRLLAQHHKPCPPEHRPKILGLTASPAGMGTIEDTYQMLQFLCQNLGGAKVAIVQIASHLEDLRNYQSDAKLVVDYKPFSDKEIQFRQKIIEYICRCYLKLDEISDIGSHCSWNIQDLRRSRDLSEYVIDLNSSTVHSLLEALPNVQLKADDNAIKGNLKFLVVHCQVTLLALSDLEGCGIPASVADIQTLEKNPESGFLLARNLGIPCEDLQELVKTNAHAGHVLQEFEDDPVEVSLYSQLLETLSNKRYIDWTTKQHTMALVLVRERAHAHRLSNFLKQLPLISEHGLKVTYVVGHGKGTADGGMRVPQQKRVLEGMKSKKYNITVATSVAEEGVDISECQLVVCMNPPSTVTGLIQMRGRARKKDSHFVILCKNSVEKQKIVNLLEKEKIMMQAAEMFIQLNGE